VLKFIPKTKVIYSFNPDLKPVETANIQDIIIFETMDALGEQLKSETDKLENIDFSKVNPATGPVKINGVSKGDALAVKILDIKLPETGVMVVAPNAGALPEMVKESKTRIVKIRNGIIHFPGNIRMEAKPMIGVIGVATEKEEIPTGTPWKHGGNLDTKEVTIGNTIYLPVSQDGGLLALGDVHALQSDGELCVSAVEISSTVMVEVDVKKGMAPPWPVIETSDSTIIVASGKTVDEAIHEATKWAVKALEKGLNIPWEDAYMLGSLIINLEISQVVDPNKTVKARIPKRYISTEAILQALSTK